jgi:hypothetical protein
MILKYDFNNINKKLEVPENRVTFSIFDNLLHLPDDMIWRIIRDSCYNNSILPKIAGTLLDYDFWPHWDKENTGNKNYVEPDMFLRFENVRIIIEAKLEYNKQGIGQWEKEILSYYNEYNDPVILLAIDGIDNEDNEEIPLKDKSVCVIKSRWKKLFTVIERCINEISNIKYTNNKHIFRTLSLINDYLLFFGYYEKIWFNEILLKEIVFDNIEDSILLLKNYFKEVSYYNNNWLNSLIDKNLAINYSNIINSLIKIGA